MHVEGGAFAAHGLRTERLDRPDDRAGPPADTVASLLPHYEAALGGEPQAFEYRTQDATRLYSCSSSRSPTASGAIGSVVAVMQDVTDRARMTSDLARSEGRLREAERMVGVGSWELVVATGEITYSAGLARLLELEDDQPLDKYAHLVLIHPADRELVAAIGEQCVLYGSMSCEYRVVLPSGTTRTLSVHAEAITLPDGRREHLRGAVLDVTAEREAERQRLAAEHLFREGFDAAPIGMSLSDPVEGRCVRVNDAMCRLLGRAREELIGQYHRLHRSRRGRRHAPPRPRGHAPGRDRLLHRRAALPAQRRQRCRGGCCTGPRCAARTARSRPSTPSWSTSPTARSASPGWSTMSRRRCGWDASATPWTRTASFSTPSRSWTC